MMQADTLALRAFWRLAESARALPFISGNAGLYALAWLAAGRLVAGGEVPGVTSIESLVEAPAWKSLRDAGFPDEALDLVGIDRSAAGPSDIARRAVAADIVLELHREAGHAPWDVMPGAFDFANRRTMDGAVTLLPQLVDLLLDLLGTPDGELWIPFDYSGQLTVCALRRGWSVSAVSPFGNPSLMSRLLLTIECGRPWHPEVRLRVSKGATDFSHVHADYLLVCPPFGMPMQGSRLEFFDSVSGRGGEQYARSETWAVHEFVNRTDKRAVFLLPQGLLFTKGQEQRLREYLLERGGERNEVEAVIALPPGTFGAAVMAGGVLVSNVKGCSETVRMVDLRSGRRAVLEAAEILQDGHDAALGAVASPEKVKLVSREEIRSNEFSFAPSRYLRRISDLGVKATKLEAICSAIRPPTTSKEPTSEAVAEVGLPDLGSWASVRHPLDKTVYLKGKARDVSLLQPGDILISIKGSIGRTALMGQAANDGPTVVSQSCLALRLASTSAVTPEYLLMYLRSQQGQAQLDGLQVGAGVQHISPSTLLSSVLIPDPTPEEAAAVLQDYHKLCEMEAAQQQLQKEMADLSAHRWTAEAR